jgi:hypothetical protein
MNFLQRKNRNPQQKPPSGNTQNTSTNPLKTATDSLKNAAEKTKEVLTNTVQAVANLFRVEYNLAVPDNEALCETIELETATNTTLNLNFKELCDTELVACCENPEYRVYTQPNNGGTLTILDPVLGTATYKPKKGFLGKECFVVEIACDDEDYNSHLVVCVKVGACACSPLRYSIGEDCTLCETIDCQIANPKQPNAAKQYELVANSVVGGTATVSTNGQLEFTPQSGATEANFQVLLTQGCNKCCIDVFVDITSVCEPCEHELSWDTCANQTPPIFDLPICNFCNCHCPKWSAVASAGEFAWVKDANGKDTSQWTITPPSQFAGLIKVTFTATCYDKTTVTTSCTIDVNHCCNDYAIEWTEGCNIANTVSFEYNCGSCESGCKNAQFVAQNVPEGVTVSLAPISNSSVIVTVTTSGTRDIEFDIVSTCSNKPGACYGHVIVTDEYCPDNWTRISGKCLPTCDPNDPDCGCPEGYFNIAGICFELCDANAKKECNQCADGFTHVTLLLADGSSVCVCLPTDECPTGWVHVNGLCLPTCVNGVCPDGFICINGICLPLCVNGNCPDGFAPVTLDINGVATCVCFPECVDGNCPEGWVCAGTICLPECVNGVCPEGMICINGICLPLCVGGNCPDGFAPVTLNINGVATCVCFPECVDGNCPEGWVCAGTICLPECVNGVCPEGMICINGICLPLCVDGNCPDGFAPVTLDINGVATCVCFPECVDGNCPEGWVCAGTICLPECVNGVCPEGMICINGICLPLCVGGNCPDGFAPVTLNINGVATCVCFPECVDGNCPEGWVCAGTICLPECVNGVCPEGMICINGICLPLCVGGNCPNGFAPATITVNGANICVCLPECVDGNCPEGFECVGGLCLPECVDGECPEGFYPQTIQVDGVDVCVCHTLCPVTLTTFATQTFNGSVGNSVNSTIPQLNAACSGTETYNLSNAINNLPAGVTFGVNGSNATLAATSDAANVGSFAIQNVEVLCDNVLVGTTTFNINIAPTVTTKPSHIITDASGTWQCTNGTMTGQLTITSVEPIPPTSTLQVASGYVNTTYGVPVANAADYTVDANGLITVINEVSTLVLDITFANPNCADMPSIVLGISNANYPPNTLTWGGHNAKGGKYVATSNIPMPFVKGNKGDYIIYGGFASNTPTDGSLHVYYGTSVNGSAFNNTTPVAYDGNQTSVTVLTPFANGNYLQVCLTDGTNTVCDKKRVPLPKIDEVISATDIVYSFSNLAADAMHPNFIGSGYNFNINYTYGSGASNSGDLQYDSSGNTVLNTLPTFAMPDIANNTVTLNIAGMLAVGITDIVVTLSANNEYSDTAIISSVQQVIDTWNSSNCGAATFTPIFTFATDGTGGALMSLDVQATGLTNAATLEVFVSPNNGTGTSPSTTPFSYNLNDTTQYANIISVSPYEPKIFADEQTEPNDQNNWLVLRVTDGACVYYVIIWYGEFILCTDPTNAIKYVVVNDINDFDPSTTPMLSATIDTTPICP